MLIALVCTLVCFNVGVILYDLQRFIRMLFVRYRHFLPDLSRKRQKMLEELEARRVHRKLNRTRQNKGYTHHPQFNDIDEQAKKTLMSVYGIKEDYFERQPEPELLSGK